MSRPVWIATVRIGEASNLVTLRHDDLAGSRGAARAARGACTLEGHGPLSAEPSAAPGFDEELERAACECVLVALDGLKPEYADILRRVDVDGASVEIVARRARISAGNARVRLYRARRALRREVELTCRTCAVHGCFDCTCAPRPRGPVRGVTLGRVVRQQSRLEPP